MPRFRRPSTLTAIPGASTATAASSRHSCPIGGVDSSVAAALLHRAIGDQLTCVFVDHGLLRRNEAEQVLETFATHLGVRVVHVDATDEFLDGARRRRRSRSASARSSVGCSSTCSSAKRRS